jgi:hypothetical protein
MDALCRRTVREIFRRDAPACHALKPIIAHRGCRAQAGLDIARIDLIALLCGMSPNPGEAVRLQL